MPHTADPADRAPAGASEDRLTESDAPRLSLMADRLPALMWLSDETGACVDLNHAALQFRGRTLEQESGDRWLEGVHPADRERCATIYRNSFAARESFELHCRLLRADGRYRTVVSAGAPWYRDDGTFAGFVGSCLDVTDLVETTRALQRSEEMYRATVDSLHEGVMVFDEAARVIAMNSAAAALLGLPRPVVGEGLFAVLDRLQIIAADSAPVPDARDRLREILQSRQAREFGPIGWVGQDGQERWSMVRVEPLHGPDPQRSYGAVASLADVTSLRQEVAEIRREAGIDPLTGLATRGELLSRLRRMQARAALTGSQLAVAFCDIDDFKAVNDELGHAAGDDLLRQLASRVRESVRAGDVVARFGGDELVVVLDPVPDPLGAVSAAEKVRRAVAEPVTVGGSQVRVAVSIGVTLVVDGEDPQICLNRADTAMYQAKKQGRDQVVYLPRE